MKRRNARRRRQRHQKRKQEATLLDCKAVASRLSLSCGTIYRWLRKGILKGSKVGRVWRVSEAELEAFAGMEGEWTNKHIKTKLYTTEEAAELLGVHQKTVIKLLQQRKLRGKRIGRRWRIAEHHLRTK